MDASRPRTAPESCSSSALFAELAAEASGIQEPAVFITSGRKINAPGEPPCLGFRSERRWMHSAAKLPGLSGWLKLKDLEPQSGSVFSRMASGAMASSGVGNGCVGEAGPKFPSLSTLASRATGPGYSDSI